jgi:hypothetical protein
MWTLDAGVAMGKETPRKVLEAERCSGGCESASTLKRR